MTVTFKCAGCGRKQKKKRNGGIPVPTYPPEGWTMSHFWRQNPKTGQIVNVQFATCSSDCYAPVRGKVSDQEWFQTALKEFFEREPRNLR